MLGESVLVLWRALLPAGCVGADDDGDEVLDADDACPREAEDRDGFEDADGCPDPDDDADRIVDARDSCPRDAEVYNGMDDGDGCPDEGRARLEGDQIVLLDKVYFEPDSDEIQERSTAILEAVAETLFGHPEIRRVEVQGHSDERAQDSYNLLLTQDRAESVLEALVDRGVERSRLRAAGYGERCPLDPRHNETAWSRNRRVELKILETDLGPTGVALACPAGRAFVPAD